MINLMQKTCFRVLAAFVSVVLIACHYNPFEGLDAKRACLESSQASKPDDISPAVLRPLGDSGGAGCVQVVPGMKCDCIEAEVESVECGFSDCPLHSQCSSAPGQCDCDENFAQVSCKGVGGKACVSLFNEASCSSNIASISGACQCDDGSIRAFDCGEKRGCNDICSASLGSEGNHGGCKQAPLLAGVCGETAKNVLMSCLQGMGVAYLACGSRSSDSGICICNDNSVFVFDCGQKDNICMDVCGGAPMSTKPPASAPSSDCQKSSFGGCHRKDNLDNNCSRAGLPPLGIDCSSGGQVIGVPSKTQCIALDEDKEYCCFPVDPAGGLPMYSGMSVAPIRCRLNAHDGTVYGLFCANLVDYYQRCTLYVDTQSIHGLALAAWAVMTRHTSWLSLALLVLSACDKTSDEDEPASFSVESSQCKVSSSVGVISVEGTTSSANLTGCRFRFDTASNSGSWQFLVAGSQGSWLDPGPGWITLILSANSSENTTLTLANVVTTLPTKVADDQAIFSLGTNGGRTGGTGSIEVGANTIYPKAQGATLDADLSGVRLSSGGRLQGQLQAVAQQAAASGGGDGCSDNGDSCKNEDEGGWKQQCNATVAIGPCHCAAAATYRCFRAHGCYQEAGAPTQTTASELSQGCAAELAAASQTGTTCGFSCPLRQPEQSTQIACPCSENSPASIVEKYPTEEPSQVLVLRRRRGHGNASDRSCEVPGDWAAGCW